MPEITGVSQWGPIVTHKSVSRPKNRAHAETLVACTREVIIENPSVTPAILTEVFRGILLSLQTNSELVPQTIPPLLLPCMFQLIISSSTYYLIWSMPFYGMWRPVDVWTDVWEERIAAIFRVKKSAIKEPPWAGGCRLCRAQCESGCCKCSFLLRKSFHCGNCNTYYQE
jgi:hypothetical protein